MKNYFKKNATEEYLKLLSNTAAISVIFGIGFYLWKISKHDFTFVKIIIISSILIMAMIGAWINALIFFKKSLNIPEEITLAANTAGHDSSTLKGSVKILLSRIKIIAKKYKGLPLAIIICGIPLYMSTIVALALGVYQAIS